LNAQTKPKFEQRPVPVMGRKQALCQWPVFADNPMKLLVFYE
jgi:hypothetical protein